MSKFAANVYYEINNSNKNDVITTYSILNINIMDDNFLYY